VVALLLLLAASVGERAAIRHPPRPDLESIIVEGQRARAHTISDLDLLVIGDSSALMDVDAVRLGTALGGKRVESLATIGYVGPAGYARLLADYASAGHPVPTVIVLMHGVSLALSNSEIGERGFEAMVLEPARRCLPGTAQNVIYQHVLAPALDLPLPGAYGRFYGGAAGLVAALRDNHGTLIDPNELPARPAAVPFLLSTGVATRLEVLRRTLALIRPRRVVVAVSPIPARAVGSRTEAKREVLSAQLAGRIGAETPLNLPSYLSDELFASVTHLNAGGRRIYTDLLAAELRKRDE
jgi:hypothetical protein